MFCQRLDEIARENMCVYIHRYLHIYVCTYIEHSEVLHEVFLVIRAVVKL